MNQKRSEGNTSFTDLTRLSPRLKLFKNRWRLSAAAVFGLGSLVIVLATWETQRELGLYLVLAFAVYTVLDMLFLDRFSKQSQQAGLFYLFWNLIGMAGPVVAYYQLIRNAVPEGPALFWPLLGFPFYFLVRLFRYNIHFFPAILVPFGLLALFALVIPAFLDAGTRLVANLVYGTWLLALLLVIIIFVRSWDFYKNRFSAYREIIRWGGSDEATLEELPRKIEELRIFLRLERLSILEIFRPEAESPLRNLEEEKLPELPGADPEALRPPRYVRLLAPANVEGEPGYIKPWPLTQGLLYRAYKERRYQLCRDTHNPRCREIYHRLKDAPAYANTRSELVIPIFDGPDGQVLAFVDLQSNVRNGILREDREYLEALATALSQLMVNKRLKGFLGSLHHLRERLKRASSEREVFAHIAPFAREELDVDVVTYYQLGYGNGVPIPGPLQEGAWYPEYLENRFHRRNPPPVVLVRDWKVLFEKDAKDNRNLLPDQTGDASGMDYFILREQICSTAFLPAGTRERRLGALFLSYRERMNFSQTDRLMLNTFLQTIIPGLESMRRKQDAREGFERDLVVLHDTLGKSITTGDLLDKGLLRLQEAYDLGDEQAIKDRFMELASNLSQHIREINSVSLKTSMDLHKKLEQGLAEAFAGMSGSLEKNYPGRSFTWNFKPYELSFRFPYSFRLAIFSIAMEAAHNAFRAGNASRADIRLTQDAERCCLCLEVETDGSAWDWQNLSQDHSPFGIYNRLELAMKQMSSPGPRWEKEGRRLVIEFPILPSTETSEDPYV